MNRTIFLTFLTLILYHTRITQFSFVKSEMPSPVPVADVNLQSEAATQPRLFSLIRAVLSGLRFIAKKLFHTYHWYSPEFKTGACLLKYAVLLHYPNIIEEYLIPNLTKWLKVIRFRLKTMLSISEEYETSRQRIGGKIMETSPHSSIKHNNLIDKNNVFYASLPMPSHIHNQRDKFSDFTKVINGRTMLKKQPDIKKSSFIEEENFLEHQKQIKIEIVKYGGARLNDSDFIISNRYKNSLKCSNFLKCNQYDFYMLANLQSSNQFEKHPFVTNHSEFGSPKREISNSIESRHIINLIIENLGLGTMQLNKLTLWTCIKIYTLEKFDQLFYTFMDSL